MNEYTGIIALAQALTDANPMLWVLGRRLRSAQDTGREREYERSLAHYGGDTLEIVRFLAGITVDTPPGKRVWVHTRAGTYRGVVEETRDGEALVRYWNEDTNMSYLYWTPQDWLTPADFRPFKTYAEGQPRHKTAAQYFALAGRR